MSTPSPRSPRTLLARLRPSDERRLADILRTEKVGGGLLLLAAVAALAWASSPWKDSYATLRDTVVGPAFLENVHLDLTVGQWATDGLLAIFFFVVGLELKGEFVRGALRRPATAIVPVAAAIGGMAVPALFYVLINVVRDGETVGWAVPTATDIAFALAVVAVVGRGLPSSLRMFLLTLAVVDDLLGITIIAVFYSEDIALGWLAAAVALVVVFGLLLRRGVTSGWLLIPLAVVAWGAMHASGVHATIAGVLLGFAAPALSADPDRPSVAEHLEHIWRPVSTGLAVPVFAFFAAGVSLDLGTLGAAAADPVSQGVVLGLVVGKPIGILLTTWIVSRILRARPVEGGTWTDVLGVSCVAGIGFTVSLLIGELAFGTGSEHAEHLRAGVLAGSFLSAALGAAILLARGRAHRQLSAEDAAASTDA